jgi:metal-sulfur cluster biosynthetic enzyme
MGFLPPRRHLGARAFGDDASTPTRGEQGSRRQLRTVIDMQLTIADVACKLRARELSSVELTAAALRRADELARSLNHVGPPARSAWDCAALLRAIAGHEAGDPSSAHTAVPDYIGGLGDSLAAVRIGVADSRCMPERCDDAPATCIATATNALKGLGATIVHVSLPRHVPPRRPITTPSRSCMRCSTRRSSKRRRARLEGCRALVVAARVARHGPSVSAVSSRCRTSHQPAALLADPDSSIERLVDEFIGCCILAQNVPAGLAATGLLGPVHLEPRSNLVQVELCMRLTASGCTHPVTFERESRERLASLTGIAGVDIVWDRAFDWTPNDMAPSLRRLAARREALRQAAAARC